MQVYGTHKGSSWIYSQKVFCLTTFLWYAQQPVLHYHPGQQMQFQVHVICKCGKYTWFITNRWIPVWHNFSMILLFGPLFGHQIQFVSSPFPPEQLLQFPNQIVLISRLIKSMSKRINPTRWRLNRFKFEKIPSQFLVLFPSGLYLDLFWSLHWSSIF